MMFFGQNNMKTTISVLYVAISFFAYSTACFAQDVSEAKAIDQVKARMFRDEQGATIKGQNKKEEPVIQKQENDNNDKNAVETTVGEYNKDGSNPINEFSTKPDQAESTGKTLGTISEIEMRSLEPIKREVSRLQSVNTYTIAGLVVNFLLTLGVILYIRKR